MEGAEKNKNGAEKIIRNPHDRGYKRDLSNPKEFLHFLKKYVGAEWTKELKAEQLSLCDKEFIEKDYEGREADLLYRLVKEEGSEVYIYVLQELQSYVDYTMIFRILMYVVNTLLRHFNAADEKERQRADFRLLAVIPIVFYNGTERWTPVQSMREYQKDGSIFGEHVLNLNYYLIDLSEIEEEYILKTNTVIDNMMYCDKLRRKTELVSVLQTAYGRVHGLSSREAEDFDSWVKNILLSICGSEEIAGEIISWLKKEGEREMDKSFKIGILQDIEREKEEARIAGHAEGLAEGRAEGHAEGLAEGRVEGYAELVIEILEDLGVVPGQLRERIMAQKDTETLKRWNRMAVQAESIEAFASQIADM